MSLLRALLDDGVERSYAVGLVSDTTWKVYERWGTLWKVTSGRRARARDNTYSWLMRRVQPDGTVALRFPFEPPGYVARHRPDEPGFAFDVTRCAVAGYFRDQGAVDLCLASWCNLDYPLAEMGGLALKRTKTLVEGADACDFRWRLADAQTETLASRT